MRPKIHPNCNQTKLWTDCRKFTLHKNTQRQEDAQKVTDCGRVIQNAEAWSPCPWFTGTMDWMPVCLCAAQNSSAIFEGDAQISTPAICCTQNSLKAVTNELGYPDCACPN